MHGSDRVPDLNIDYERALVGRAQATASTRAKWRSSRSACCSVLEKCLTPPTLSERPVNNGGGQYAMPRLAVKNTANLGCQVRIRTRTMFMRIESLR
jgi:hypothetical protein